MSSDSSGEVEAWLRGSRLRILEGIKMYQESDKGAYTERLTDFTNMSSDNLRHHTRLLMEPPEERNVSQLVRKLDEAVSVGRGSPSPKYRLTKAGEEVVSESNGGGEFITQNDLKELEETVTQVDAATSGLGSRLEGVSDQVESLEKSVESLDERVGDSEESGESEVTREDIQTLARSIKSNRESCESLENQVDDVDKRVTELESKLESMINVIRVVKENEDYLG